MATASVGDKLVSAVAAVDWHANITAFSAASGIKDRVAAANQRIAQWAKQLENSDKRNPALTFMREVQIQGHYAAALLSLGLYKPAASAMRAMVESALYYTYFRSHAVELETLVRDASYFLDKKSVLEFQRKHSVDFSEKQKKLGLLSRLDPWYADISAIVHGQVPGKWTTHMQLKDIGFVPSVCEEAVSAFERGEEIIHRLLLCTVPKKLWYGFSATAKKQLLKGLKPEAKTVLGLPTV